MYARAAASTRRAGRCSGPTKAPHNTKEAVWPRGGRTAAEEGDQDDEGERRAAQDDDVIGA
jgi:hypothetical protein